MAIAMTLKDYLDESGVDYDVLVHIRTSSNAQTAKAAHIPSTQLAKSVMLEAEDGRYILAVIPADHHLDLGELHRRLKSHIGLTTEEQLGELFDDCVLGAVPPVGEAYGFNVIWDDDLAECSDVYFEAGDHRRLVHTSGEDFKKLMGSAEHGHLTMLS